MKSEVPVLINFLKLFACRPETDSTDFGLVQEPKGPFVHFIPEVCKMAGRTSNTKAEAPTLAECISAQTTDMERRSAFAFVGKPSSFLTPIATDRWFEFPF